MIAAIVIAIAAVFVSLTINIGVPSPIKRAEREAGRHGIIRKDR